MRPADDLDRRESRTDLAAESPNRRLARHRFLARRKFLESLGGAAIGMATVKGRSGAQDRSAGDGPVVPANPRSLVAKGRAAAAATVHPLATQAAMNAFRRGGNAIDAAVAAAFMLGVVDGHNSGIGGGCLILARLADGRLIAIDGREIAPAAATRDMFIRDGKPDPQASTIGPLASGVPGQVAALAELSLLHGRGDWSAGLREAADVAAVGFRLPEAVAGAIRRKAKSIARFSPSAKALLREDGSPPETGETLRQPDLATTLRALADEGPDWFYRGPFAKTCAAWMSDNGGILTAADFAGYAARNRQPIMTPYRGWIVAGFPPPSSGGVHIAQMLRMLEPFPMSDTFREDPSAACHLLAEVMKRAFADRAHWLGDADHVAVPRGLIDPDYCRQRMSDFDPRRATKVASHGQPPRTDIDLFSDRHTTHLATADGQGNWVAITNTVNTSFGSCVVIPGTGVVMNNELDDFSIAPGTPNAFGLVGAEANAIAPGKRPLSSMSPTIVIGPDGNPRLTCGAAGGPRIINAVLQVVLRTLDAGEPIDAAIAAPRVHHQWEPDRLVMERGFERRQIEALRDLGHDIGEPSDVAIAQGIECGEGGELIAAADPRTEGAAAAT